MVKRFFGLLIGTSSYEIEYRLEIARMVFVHLFCFGTPWLFWLIPGWTNINKGFVCALMVVFFYISFGLGLVSSIARMCQIHLNKKGARIIEKQELYEILTNYPDTFVYTKIDGKYKILKNNCEIKNESKIVLITIGKESTDSFFNSLRSRTKR